MTPDELKKEFAQKFGFTKWPTSYEVDAETYGRVCQAVFDNLLERQFPTTDLDEFALTVVVGPNNGIMFKGIELLLKGRVR